MRSCSAAGGALCRDVARVQAERFATEAAPLWTGSEPAGLGCSSAPASARRPSPRVCPSCSSIAAAVCSVVYTVGLKVMIDGAIARSGGRIALGAALVAVLFTLGWLLAVIGGSRGSLLTEQDEPGAGRADHADRRIAADARALRATGPACAVGDPHRRPAHARGGPAAAIDLLGQALRAIGMVVLLALIYLPVLLVPLLALAPAFANRRASRVQRRADESLAEDRRMLDELFTLATSAASARELRTTGSPMRSPPVTPISPRRSGAAR